MLTRGNRRVNRLARIVGFVLIVAFSIGALSACKAEEPVAPAVAAPKVASPSAKVSGDLDPGHPEWLPLWEGATVVASTLPGETVYDLELTTTDTYDDVVYGVGKGLEDDGFTVEVLNDSPEATVYMAIKGDFAAVYTMEPAEAGVSIVISAQLPVAE